MQQNQDAIKVNLELPNLSLAISKVVEHYYKAISKVYGDNSISREHTKKFVEAWVEMEKEEGLWLYFQNKNSTQPVF